MDSPRLPDSGGRAHVAYHHVDPFDDDSLLVNQDPFHSPLTSLLFAGDDQDCVSSPNLHLYTTSGAREIMRMKPRSLSSLATGPKMRLPLGLS